MKVISLATCHNRLSETLAALGDLHNQLLNDDVVFSHAIVDDGSMDGTSAAVASSFPEVKIIPGNGNLFWAGGMRHGWDEYIRYQNFDYLFVYNDDVRFDSTAVNELLAASPGSEIAHVVTGSFRYENGQGTSYGGRLRSTRWHPLKFGAIVEPNGSVQEADTLNMNGALISRAALDAVGFLSDYFVHSGADFEFGLKLRKSGGQVLVAPHHIGVCDMNVESNRGPGNATTLKEALAMLRDVKREPIMQRLIFYRRHAGLFWPALFISPYVSVWLRQGAARIWKKK